MIFNLYLKSTKKNTTEKETPLPLYETNPIVLGEKTSPDASELAVKLAKKWVEESRLGTYTPGQNYAKVPRIDFFTGHFWLYNRFFLKIKKICVHFL